MPPGKFSLAPEQILSAIRPFYSGLSEQQAVDIQKYIYLLTLWNESVSMTSVSEPCEMVSRHFGESLFAISLLGSRVGRLADVGTGAGFPGLPLKIAVPAFTVMLLEPNLKKCAFLAEVQQQLSLDGVEIIRRRYEDSDLGQRSTDFVCSRALGDYRHLLKWARTVLKPDGRVVLWLGSEDSTTVAKTKGWVWNLPVTIPESRRRVVLVGVPAYD